MKYQVIYDIDFGIDDVMVLWLFVCSFVIELCVIMIVFGNVLVEIIMCNVLLFSMLYGLKLLVVVGVVKVFVVVEEGDYLVYVYGEDGFGGLVVSVVFVNELLDLCLVYQLICDMVNVEFGVIILIVVGLFINFVFVLQYDLMIVGKVKQVILMGGVFGMLGYGGNVMLVVEVNVINDFEVVDVVLIVVWFIVVVGFDVIQQVVMDEDYLLSLQG